MRSYKVDDPIPPRFIPVADLVASTIVCTIVTSQDGRIYVSVSCEKEVDSTASPRTVLESDEAETEEQLHDLGRDSDDEAEDVDE